MPFNSTGSSIATGIKFPVRPTPISTSLNTDTTCSAENFNGDIVMSAIVNDLAHYGSGGSLSDEKTFIITVNPVNDFPEGIDDSFSMLEDEVVNLSAFSDFIDSLDLEDLGESR